VLLALLLAVAAPDPGFDAIVQRVGEQSHDVSCAQMQTWVDAHRDDPNAGRGLVWMAELRLADHKLDDARAQFARAQADYPGTEWGWQGEKGVADLDVVRHRYTSAIASYDRLSRLPTPYWQYVGRMSGISARAEQHRWYAFVALMLAMVAGVALRLWRARGALWPLPEEVTFALPVAAVMLAAALAQPAEEAHAVCTVALGALVLLYAHGVHLRARAPATWVRVVEALLGLGEAAALLFIAVVANDLWMKFAETLTSGAER
jgi:hypothetical protein